MRCIDEGYSFVDPEQGMIPVALPPPDKGFASHLLITGKRWDSAQFMRGYGSMPAIR
jgi:hypothetical protein